MVREKSEKKFQHCKLFPGLPEPTVGVAEWDRLLAVVLGLVPAQGALAVERDLLGGGGGVEDAGVQGTGQSEAWWGWTKNKKCPSCFTQE